MRKIVLFGMVLSWCAGFAQTPPEDYNQRGIDPRVNYNELWQKTVPIGIPWDDRNLGLIKEDLEFLPTGEFEDTQNIPVWFRVKLRRQNPQMRSSGEGQYPRSAAEVYEIFWGGAFLSKKFEKVGNQVVINGEVNVTGTRKSAESAIAINPFNSDLVIAGVNGPSSQEMYYSSDGGVTFTRSTSNLGASCCDPTVAWSPDGTIGYMSQLGTCPNFCNIEFFTSFDNGMTWGNKVTVKGGGTNDKQYLHVDQHPTSPFNGHLYMHWHSFNTIEFARSTTQGVTWDTPVSFSGTNGIGGDITTDTNGKIYHIWPRISGGVIRMNTSTDGGQTFSAITQIADTNASFIYSIPVFDNREAFIYVSTDVDRTSGPFQNRVYACWNDTNGPESGTPANNHSKITITWSSDGGTTWNEVTPHPTSDILTVDRFNPWMEVDSDGTVHVTYASTQNDPNRRSMDIYHTFSIDGAVTWSTPQRITQTTSPYISDGFQWGDYNGMSIVDGKVRPIWTDNRSGVRVYTLDGNFNSGDGDFAITSADPTTAACVGQNAPAIDLDLSSISGFNSPVTLAFDPPLPAGITGGFTGSPVTPPGTASVNLSVGMGAPEGVTQIRVVGTGGGRTHDIMVNLTSLTLDLANVAALWLDEGGFNDNYDLVDDEVINVLDLVAFVDFCAAP